MGGNDQETEAWFTSIMHPVVGASYSALPENKAAKPDNGNSNNKGDKTGSNMALKSPHRKNSLTPGSSSAASAALTASANATEKFTKNMEITTAESGKTRNNSLLLPLDDDTENHLSFDTEPDAKGVILSSIPDDSASPLVSASPKADGALQRSESALLEAAKLANEWRESDGDITENDAIVLEPDIVA